MRFNSIASFNEYLRVAAPKHPFVDVGEYPKSMLMTSGPVHPNFYRVSLKYGLEHEKGKGYMYFSSPNQPIQWKAQTPWNGFYINITEDLVSTNQHLQYSFLNYGLHEPLFLNEAEELIITRQFEEITKEYSKKDYSLDLVLAYCNLIFAHVSQCYKRQFGERKKEYNALVNDFFHLLDTYYIQKGNGEIVQPSVNYFADRLHITPNYLSDVVRYHSGKPALEHIHEHIVAQAKQLLAQKRYSVSEIAYQLGFEYPSYFTRLFRKQTGTTPSQYRNR